MNQAKTVATSGYMQAVPQQQAYSDTKVAAPVILELDELLREINRLEDATSALIGRLEAVTANYPSDANKEPVRAVNGSSTLSHGINNMTQRVENVTKAIVRQIQLLEL